MSVQFHELTLAVPSVERRQTPRFRFSILMPATLGRGDAVILDISARGARVMHFAAHALGARIRLAFSYGGHRFAANGRVLASRVMGLGNGPGGTTTYQSRFELVDTADDAAETLTRIIEHIERERLQTWQSNLDGHEAEQAPDGDGIASYFVRCRYLGGRWIKTWTRLDTQPSDGFTVPARLSDGEVTLLCEAYMKLDDEGRDLIRATAASAD